VTQITIKNIYNACHKLKQSIRNLRIEIQNLMKCLVEDKYIYIYIATKIKEMNQFIEFLVVCDWSK
jgi:hypothetical protein